MIKKDQVLFLGRVIAYWYEFINCMENFDFIIRLDPKVYYYFLINKRSKS